MSTQAMFRRSHADMQDDDQELGEQTSCLVDLGHHAPNVNVEMIVARMIQFGKLGGIHFDDFKCGGDDLDTGSIDPFRLFLVFNELVDAEHRNVKDFDPAHMLDQSLNVTYPIATFRASGYRAKVSAERPAISGAGGGIV